MNNINIITIKSIITPNELIKKIKILPDTKHFINIKRTLFCHILNGLNHKLIVIVGPCSIHNYDNAIKYAHFLKKMIEKYKEHLFIIMRVYFEKPRTTIGWKGFLYDPKLDGTNDIETGLNLARTLLLELNKMQIPCASEALDTLTPQYFGDLITYYAVGARTVESQLHRQLVSGLSTPVGFKNSTNGAIDVAINAIISSKSPHSFLGTNIDGQISIVNTSGNKNCNIILRGSNLNTNYSKTDIQNTENKMLNKKLIPSIIVDASHGNSKKNFKNQQIVVNDICKQISDGNVNIHGVMLESNIHEGKQNINDKPLKFGVSITDSCINIQKTDELLQKLFNAVQIRNNSINEAFLRNLDC